MRDREMPGENTRWRAFHAVRQRLRLQPAPSAPPGFASHRCIVRWRALFGVVAIATSLLLPATLVRSWAETRAAPRWLHAATALVTPVPCVGENLLPNPGFEAGLHAWYVAGSVAPTTLEVQSGIAAVRLGAPVSDGYMDRRIDPVIGATYTLSGWGKLSSAGEQATIGVSFYDAKGERLSAAEPAPLLFTSTTFVEQQLTFTVPAGVSVMDVYLAKPSGATLFVADSLSLTRCQAAAPVLATPFAIPVAASPIVAASPAVATPGAATPTAVAPEATPLATPSTNESAPLVTYVDPDINLVVGYPAGWRRLTEDEIRAQLAGTSDAEVATTLATTRLVVVSPDGQAALSLTVLPRSSDDASLTAVAQSIAAADAAKVSGSGEITTESAALAGREAIRLRFSADDAAGERLIQQLVTVEDDSTIILAFVARRDAAAANAAMFQQIVESVRWQPQP